jgi:6-hydroxytryprostatin B O-methyltransferase
MDTITRLKLPQNVPLEGSISIKDLSETTRIPLDYLTRVVRFAIANSIFIETEPGVIAHSGASAALHENQHLSNIVHFGTEFLGNILVKTPHYLVAQRDDAASAPKSPFNIAYGTDKNLFEYFHGNADLTQKYHEYLAGRVNTPLWSIDRLRAAWPWASKGDATVVDVRLLIR